MRILLLQRFDLASVSCARRVLCQAEELAQRGHEVILTDFVHRQRQQEVPSVANLSSLGARILPMNRSVFAAGSNLKVLLSLQPQPDLIHLWKAYPDASLPAIYLSRRWNIPLHYDWDDWEKGIARELAGSYWAGWTAGKWDRLLPRLSYTVSVASDFLRDKALQWGTPPDRLWDAPVGADLERFHPREKDPELLEKLGIEGPVLAYSGQLEVASYAEQAVDIFALVVKEIPTAKLLILGGGRKLESIKKRAMDKQVFYRVLFTDYVPGGDVPRYLSLADVALAPFELNDVTRAKSPLKIAEYLAMGLPVVASDVGETRKMTLGAGSCAACGDIKTMTEKTLWILKNPNVRQSMSAAGRKTAERKYNWKVHVDSLEAAYRCALGKL
ncbi:MAG: glycosyltransferase family 4 protein [Candidatus Omnitrophota bacterium]